MREKEKTEKSKKKDYDLQLRVIYLNCKGNDKETWMNQKEFDNETQTWRFECPKCDNIILIQKFFTVVI